MDCYNDEAEPGVRHTSTEPEVLRVTGAGISDMLSRTRERQGRPVAVAERDAELLL